MKKTLLTIALAGTAAFASAQDMMSKKGTPILPEAEDWSIGISVNPFFDYFGNMFNGSTNNSSPSWDFAHSNQVITGKYMIDENTAYRGMIRIGFGSETKNNVVDDDASTTNPPATVTDEWKVSHNDITLGLGKQWYRGKGRLRGYYGPEIFVSFGSSSNDYSYGNAYSASNPAPTSTDFTSPNGSGGFNSGPAFSRTTEAKNGSTFGFGIRGFIGAEYFFAPKMSISGEFGWGLAMTSIGEGESTTQFWNGTSEATSTGKIGKSSTFSLDTDNASGNIVLSFYF